MVFLFVLCFVSIAALTLVHTHRLSVHAAFLELYYALPACFLRQHSLYISHSKSLLYLFRVMIYFIFIFFITVLLFFFFHGIFINNRRAVSSNSAYCQLLNFFSSLRSLVSLFMFLKFFFLSFAFHLPHIINSIVV